MKQALNTYPNLRTRFARAFTVVEVIVAMGVLALLMVMVAQLVHSGNLVISGSRKRLSADAQAREVFSRFDLDVRRMPLRADCDVLLSSDNRTMFFYSEAGGFYTTADTAQQGGLSLVGYRVSTNAQLERLGKGLYWTNTLFLTYTTPPTATNSTSASPVPASTMPAAWSTVIGTSPLYKNGTDSDYHVIGDGVFGTFYCFQKKDGTYSLTLDSAATSAGLSAAGRFHDVAAIVLTLAIVDDDSRKTVPNLASLTSALPQPTQADLAQRILPGQRWQQAVANTSAFATAAGISESAAGRVRIYQRSFPLNAP